MSHVTSVHMCSLHHKRVHFSPRLGKLLENIMGQKENKVPGTYTDSGLYSYSITQYTIESGSGWVAGRLEEVELLEEV